MAGSVAFVLVESGRFMADMLLLLLFTKLLAGELIREFAVKIGLLLMGAKAEMKQLQV